MFHPRHRSSVQIRFLAAAALAGVTLLAARPAAAEWITGVSAADPLVAASDEPDPENARLRRLSTHARCSTAAARAAV